MKNNDFQYVNLSREDNLNKENKQLDKDLFFYENDYTKAITFYEKGLSLFKEGNDTGALNAFDMALIYSLDYLDRDYCLIADILYNKVLVMLHQGDFEDGLAYLNKLSALVPDNANILNLKGLGDYYLKAYEEAIINFNKALDYDPHNIEVLNNKGNALLKLGKNKEALELYDKALNYSKNYKVSNNEFTKFECSYKINPKNFKFDNNELLNSKKYNKDIFFISNKPTNYYILNHLYYYFISDVSLDNKNELISLTHKGIAYENSNNYEKALTMFDAVIALDEKFYPALYHKATVLEKQGKFKSALDFYRKAEEINPNYHGELIGSLEIGKSANSSNQGLLVTFSKTLVQIFH
jgi:tetratricopeptide (TPR) repeat protein